MLSKNHGYQYRHFSTHGQHCIQLIEVTGAKRVLALGGGGVSLKEAELGEAAGGLTLAKQPPAWYFPGNGFGWLLDFFGMGNMVKNSALFWMDNLGWWRMLIRNMKPGKSGKIIGVGMCWLIKNCVFCVVFGWVRVVDDPWWHFVDASQPGSSLDSVCIEPRA